MLLYVSKALVVDRKKEQYKKIFNLGSNDLFDTGAKSALYQSIRRQHRKRRTKRMLSYTAGIAAALSLFFLFYLQQNSKKTAPELNIMYIARQNEDAIGAADEMLLISSVNGRDSSMVNPLNTDGVNTALSLEGHIIPDMDKVPVYSTVYVPYGKRQAFILPDKSTAWLNAGSYLTFRNDMSQGTREVYLNGEGYFDIAHNGLPFVVRTAQTSINVLGTTFNVNSYEEDSHTTIELLTGSIALQSTKGLFGEIKMKPGERVDFDSRQSKISINRKANGDDILWTKRQLVLQRLSIDALARKLERVYNVKIHLDSQLRALQVAYSGRLNIDVDIVSSLSSLYELKDYEITQIEKEVWIRKK